MTETSGIQPTLPSAVERFILHWGEMGTHWGVNRSVSQIHALLYLSEKPLTAEEIAERLGLARSNVSNSVKELLAWSLTRAWLGDYYRTYPTTVEDEVKAALASPADFDPGPLAVLRDDPAHPERGFVVEDGSYVSARWPGDAHRFTDAILARLR